MPVYITAVYAKCIVVQRHALWEDLLQVQSQVQDSPWLLCGDFNNILSMDEAAGRGTPDIRSWSEFSDFVTHTDLRELPSVTGCVFTRTGIRRQGRVWR